jgi:hypothetical protein
MHLGEGGERCKILANLGSCLLRQALRQRLFIPPLFGLA